MQERVSFVSCGLTRTPRLHEGHLQAMGAAPPKSFLAKIIPRSQNHGGTREEEGGGGWGGGWEGGTSFTNAFLCGLHSR